MQMCGCSQVYSSPRGIDLQRRRQTDPLAFSLPSRERERERERAGTFWPFLPLLRPVSLFPGHFIFPPATSGRGGYFHKKSTTAPAFCVLCPYFCRPLAAIDELLLLLLRAQSAPLTLCMKFS